MPEPDRSFMRDLRNIDSRLGTKFNGSHFVVTYKRPYGEPVNILRIQGEGGSFRQPDRRDLTIIKGGDLAEGPKMETRLKEAAYRAEKQREADKRKVHEDIRNMTKDDKTFLKRKIGQALNIGKCNSEFRRITPKKKKNVVATI